MLTKKNHLLLLLLFLYTVLGIYLSISNGITSDEHHEQYNWVINASAINNFIKNGNYDELLNYGDRYHGIAFHLISQPIQIIFSKFVSNLNDLSIYGGYLITKHAVVFLLFSISGIFFYLLCLKISQSFPFSFVSTLIYLLYPYLFGHAQFNGKDIPFLTFWLINSYVFLSIIESIFHDQNIKLRKVIFFSFLTAFLISIRVTGVIIFVEYLIGLIILFNIKDIIIINFFKKFFSKIFIFSITFLTFLYILNPILWLNPLEELLNSIKWMGKYHIDICTLTLGDCMRSQNLPASYYFIWLFFKLPILIVLGFLCFPFVEKKIFSNKVKSIYYGTLFFSVISIIFIFILKKIAIYDELRHVMFVVPIICLLSLINIFYLNKKFFYSFGVLVLIFFIFENLALNPYQYTWLNSFAKFTNIPKNFEIDYWGVSNKKLNQKIIEYTEKNSISKDTCVYGDIFAKEFLKNKNFKCFKTYSKLDSAIQRPLFAYKIHRNVKRSDPKDCTLIWNETYQYSFYKKDISVGTLWFCN